MLILSSEWLAWSMLAFLLCTSCSRTGLGTRTAASVSDAAVADARDAGDTSDAGDADETSDALTDAGDSTHCTPGVFTLGGLPVPQLPGFPSAVSIADLNGDGYADLAVTLEDLATVSVLLGRGDGTFGESKSFATGRSPVPVAVADVNEDGKTDLIVGNTASGTVSILAGAGNGSFAAKEDYAAGEAPSALAIGDTNGDGHPDIAVASFQAKTVTLLHNRGAGAFSQVAAYAVGAQYSGPRSVAMGDLDGDGRADIAVDGPLTLIFPSSDGTVTIRKIDEGTDATANSVVMGDLNGDGSLDLAWTTGKAIRVMLNQGRSGFAEAVDYSAGPVTACPSYRLTLGDVNADGRLDLAALNDDCENITLVQNLGDGTFADATVFYPGGYPLWSVIGDVNGDQRGDLVVSTGGKDLTILLAQPDGSFLPDWVSDSPRFADSYAFGDLDGDGRLDLVVEDVLNAPSVLLGPSDGPLASPQPHASSFARGITVLDVNGDGDADITYWEVRRVSVALGFGDGSFAPQVDTTFDRVLETAALGDLDGDGDADLVVAFRGASSVSVMYNQDGGRFAGETGYETGGIVKTVVLGDLNADGRLDIATASSEDKKVSVLHGRGDGTFAPSVDFATAAKPDNLWLGDLNSDGITDLILTSHEPDTVSVLLGGASTPSTLRDNPVGFYPWRLVGIGDVDGDGGTDLVIWQGDTTAFVLRGRGDGTFLGSLGYAMIYGGPMALADFDGDGRLDMGVAEQVDQVMRWHVYRNELCR